MVVPTFPSATAALRLRPRTFARFIGEPVTAWLYSSWRMPNNSRARVRLSRRTRHASRTATARAATFDGHTSWEMYRQTVMRSRSAPAREL